MTSYASDFHSTTLVEDFVSCLIIYPEEYVEHLEFEYCFVSDKLFHKHLHVIPYSKKVPTQVQTCSKSKDLK